MYLNFVNQSFVTKQAYVEWKVILFRHSLSHFVMIVAYVSSYRTPLINWRSSILIRVPTGTICLFTHMFSMFVAKVLIFDINVEYASFLPCSSPGLRYQSLSESVIQKGCLELKTIIKVKIMHTILTNIMPSLHACLEC